MAKTAASKMKVWLDEYALASSLTSAGLEVTQELAVVTSLADAGPRRVVGNYDATFPFLGLFDGDAGAVDEIVHALVGSAGPHYVTLALGQSVGDVAYDGLAVLEGKPLSAASGGAQALGINLAGAGGLSRGVLLGNKTTTGAENLAGVNMGATTLGQRFRAVFRVISFTGTNITLKVQESQNDGGGDAYADISGLTSGALTGAGVVSVSTTAATEAWKRLAISGTFTSAVIAVSAGVVAGG